MRFTIGLKVFSIAVGLLAAYFAIRHFLPTVVP